MLAVLRPKLRLAGAGLLLAIAAQGCTAEDAVVGSNAAAGIGAGGSGACVVSECQGHVYQCGDCIDNDGDSLIDSMDDECLGPCDNTEDSYYGGIPGQNNSPCRQDCYFDKDTGPGNDECYWSHGCDPLSVASAFPPSGDEICAYDPATAVPGTSASCADLESSQLDACRSYCEPLTPNGCDCFGCCELPAGSGQYVWLGSTHAGVGSCDLSTLADATKCKPCTPVPSCMNGCGPCEVCIGKPALEPECEPQDGGTDEQCPDGLQPCGQPGQKRCEAGEYCITGCCIVVPT